MIQTSDYLWRYAALTCWGQLDRYTATRWLCGSERQTFDRMRSAQRRAGFLAGRVLAKQLLRQALCDDGKCHDAEPGRIAITTCDRQGRQIRPEIRIDGNRMPWSLSISHTERGVLVALAPLGDDTIGVDLVAPSDYGAGFCRLWFTERERQWIGPNRPPLRVATLWALKEAVYKACHGGESFDPRRIEILRRTPDQCMLRIDQTAITRCARIWQIDHHVAAVVWGNGQKKELLPLTVNSTDFATNRGGMARVR